VIRRQREKDGRVRITFAVSDPRPVSLVCDRNAWDPYAHPLVRRSNGTRSCALVVEEGAAVRFRYLADGGEFYDDPGADAVEHNGMGGTHTVVVARL
jgi:hypothetical protein